MDPPDCDGKALRDERHIWSENTIARIYAHPDSEGVGATMEGDLKHCEKCGVVRWFPSPHHLLKTLRDIDEIIDDLD